MSEYFTEFGSLNDFISGRIALLRTDAAYRFDADAIIKIREGDMTVQKRPKYDLEIMDSYMFFVD